MSKREGLRLSREVVRELANPDVLAEVAGGLTVANRCFSAYENPTGCTVITIPAPNARCISLAAGTGCLQTSNIVCG
jgi:hypothetical protein